MQVLKSDGTRTHPCLLQHILYYLQKGYGDGCLECKEMVCYESRVREGVVQIVLITVVSDTSHVGESAMSAMLSRIIPQ